MRKVSVLYKLKDMKRINILLLFVLTPFIFAETGALVQYEVVQRNFVSEDVFSEHLRLILAEICSDPEVSLIIFPEYTGVFTQLFHSGVDFSIVKSFPEIIELISNAGYSSLKSFFLENDNSLLLDRIFGRLSREFNVYILAGTSFVPERDELLNRAFLYNPKGKRIYHQDKVYTTDFERIYIGMDSGSQGKAKYLPLGNRKIVLTICRDTYFESWDKYWKEVDLWIDISANEAVYGPVSMESSSEALLQRLDNRPNTTGISVCLAGYFLDFIWQGISSVHLEEKNGLRPVTQVKSPVTQSVLYFEY